MKSLQNCYHFSSQLHVKLSSNMKLFTGIISHWCALFYFEGSGIADGMTWIKNNNNNDEWMECSYLKCILVWMAYGYIYQILETSHKL